MELTLLYHLATQPASDCTVRYIVSAEGKIRMTLSYTPVQGLTEMPEFGLSFQMDADFDQCTWYGMGPEETYCDRCTGAKLGVFASTTQEALSVSAPAGMRKSNGRPLGKSDAKRWDGPSV